MSATSPATSKTRGADSAPAPDLAPKPAAQQASLSTWGTFLSSISTWMLPILALVGLFYLMAANKLPTAVGIPLVTAIVGVHTGAVAVNSK